MSEFWLHSIPCLDGSAGRGVSGVVVTAKSLSVGKFLKWVLLLLFVKGLPVRLVELDVLSIFEEDKSWIRSYRESITNCVLFFTIDFRNSDVSVSEFSRKFVPKL